MFSKLFIFLLIFLFIPVFFSKIQAKTTGLSEHISTSVFLSGDLQGEYDFNGPLGEVLKGTSDSSEQACKISSLFRKVKYRGQNSIEAWLHFDCTFGGQKSTYRTHRIYLRQQFSAQKIKLPMLAKNLKNVQLEFREITLKSAK